MRKLFFQLSLVSILVLVGLSTIWPPVIWSLFVVVPLIAIGINDMIQQKQTIRRNFPLVGRMRYWMEALRPKMYQYFIESDTDGTPFNRLNRSLVYQRAKKVNDTTPFGTQLDVYQVGYEWMNHSMRPADITKMDHSPRVVIGGPDCQQKYAASIFNISAMSFGSLSKNAIMALNGGAKIGGFYHNTGEGGLSPYHLEPGGDINWQIGTGYFGCRNSDGTFNGEMFAERANLPNVKMIEIKLSQGAKPGHGGILPAKKNTPEIARIRLVAPHTDILSPPGHSAFSTPLEMMDFIKQLRVLSNRKPIGFKLCVGRKSEFLALCKAMVQTGIMPDFITVDGGEGGTGAAPLEFSNSVGMPLRDGLAFIYDSLVGFGLKRHIKIIASGKVTSGFDIVKNISLGADACNSARGMMLALGCIQALECNTNNCPTGVATQNEALMKGLDVSDKKVRVANFHHETVKSAVELMTAAGVDAPKKLNRSHIYRRVSASEIQRYDETYPYLLKGCLLEAPYPEHFQLHMSDARVETFETQMQLG